jgi:hygromycin-B 7''-O-kinase
MLSTDKSVALNAFTDRAFYSSHFMDATFWEPYVRQVCLEHRVGCERIFPAVPGSFPTFIVESGDLGSSIHFRVVAKFFGPLFDGVGSFRIERDVGRWLEAQYLPIPSPAILAEGQLNPDWSYLLFEHVPGVSIGQLRSRLIQDDLLAIAHQVGEFLNCLYALPLDSLATSSPLLQPTWDGYARFLHQQGLNCLANHQAWEDLPEHLLSQIESFLMPVEQLVDFSAPPHLIHADLTADHLLGSLVNGRWQTGAFIDWGDAMTGNLLYELVALHLDLFLANKHYLRNCLEAYRLPPFFQDDFPRKALNLVLLHQFPMPASIYQPHLDVHSLPELAERLFGI